MSIESIFYANGAEGAVEEAIIRFSAVKRWHMIDTTRVQTLSDHSAAVALLVYSVAARAPDQYFGDPCHAGMAALLHDLPEVFTGDIPSHSKRFVHGLDTLEAQVTPQIFKLGIGIELRLLIKLCDLSESIWFITRHGVDCTAEHARSGLIQQLELKVTEAITNWPHEVFKTWVDAHHRFLRS
jgi:hypothetical protein